MNDDLFNELLQSVREGGAILRGEAVSSRSFNIEEPDVIAIRKKFKLSQPKFASFLGISTRTLQNWEQNRRKPEGPAKVLLQVAAKHPEAVLDVVSETQASRTRARSSAVKAARKSSRSVSAGRKATTKQTAAAGPGRRTIPRKRSAVE